MFIAIFYHYRQGLVQKYYPYDRFLEFSRIKGMNPFYKIKRTILQIKRIILQNEKDSYKIKIL